MKGQAPPLLSKIVQPVVEGLGYEWVGAELLQQGKHKVLRLYIDHESGISLDDCSQVSHQVSGLLDVEDPIRGAYALEVSSPGADRPLFTEEHFDRFVGNKVKIRMRDHDEDRRNFSGELCGMDGDDVMVEDQGKMYRLAFRDIEKARLVPDV